ncbi:MAG: PhoU domain-containing protein [Planctomycetota bacterium]|jgi:phosphate transport system protein
MTHYEERLERDLQGIRDHVADLAQRVDRAVEQAVHALLHLDRDLAAQVILGDHPINRARRETERLCHIFVARHLPSAGILRYVSSVLRLTVELERIGDYAVSVARETVQLQKPLPDVTARDLEMLAHQSRGLLDQALKAFREGNADLARGTKSHASQARSTIDKVYEDLLREAEGSPRALTDVFAVLFAFIRLVRICDQAKNICEETIFAVTGESKQPKVYDILFVDATNTYRSVMAEAIARKAYPASGAYQSAGWKPAAAPDSRVLEFLDRHNHPVAALRPKPLQTGHEELAEHHVIVDLEGDAAQHLPEIPYRTTLIRWEVGPAPGEGEPTEEVLERTYKDLTVRIRDLMEILRGDQAD